MLLPLCALRLLLYLRLLRQSQSHFLRLLSDSLWLHDGLTLELDEHIFNLVDDIFALLLEVGFGFIFQQDVIQLLRFRQMVLI